MQTHLKSLKFQISTTQILCEKFDVHLQNNRSKLCLALRKYHDVTLAENAAVAHSTCKRPHRKLIAIAILLKFSQTNLKIIYIQKIEKLTFQLKYPKGPFCVTRLILWLFICVCSNACPVLLKCMYLWYIPFDINIKLFHVFVVDIGLDN